MKKEKAGQDGSYVIKKSRKLNIFAYILCVLISLIIWLYVANRDVMRSNEISSNQNETQVSQVEN